jgi:hypothetical protein
MSNEPKSRGGTRDEKPAKEQPKELGPVELRTSVKKSEMKKALLEFADNLKKIADQVDTTKRDSSYDITLVFHVDDSHHKTSTRYHFHCNNGNGDN